MNRPNVILLTIDTLRVDRLGCYGNKAHLTPNIDRLARNGIRFNQAISGGSWTQAAFPVLLTSSYAAMYGGCLGRLAPERPSPIETLASSGYTTGGFTTNLHLSRATGYDRGFLHFVELDPGEVDPPLRRIKGGQRLLKMELTHSVLRTFGVRTRPARLYSPATEVTDSVCQWLDRVETPFFAWAHYMDVHWPYHMEETLVHPKEIARAWQDMLDMHGRSNFEGRSDRDKPITPAERDHFINLYENSLQYLDQQIGRLIDHIQNSSYADNTVVILVADHGEEFLDHGRWGHWESNLFDEILRVPLIMWTPNGLHGQVIQQQVRLLDLMPTILDLCGCPTSSGPMGTSMASLLQRGKSKYQAEEIISEMRRDPWHRVAVRTESFKYIWDSKQPDQPELYNLQTDPREKQNVRDRFPREVSHFQTSVDTHRLQVAATEPAIAAPRLKLDENVAKRLRDLGYL
ncbi:MAG TPA: sulfatase [Anaerolineales bacterium]|jgi:arylsulfatase A-like enzyme|nr:sulfatase [Anaerolineales bacterium]